MTLATRMMARSLAILGAAALAAGLSVAPAGAMPFDASAAMAPGRAGTIDLAAYMHRRYPGSMSRHHRMQRMTRKAPNYFCRNQPSRCH